VPYAFAHPAAAIPLHRLLGRLAVPSALVIGSVAPDLWLLVPFAARDQTHGMAAILWFNLPLGVLLYAAFHLVLKEPLLALMPPSIAARLSVWACPSLPRVPWTAVAASLVAGAASHIAWDAATHSGFGALEEPVVALGGHPILVQQLVQHGSTLAGTLFLIWWALRRLAIPTASPSHLATVRWRAKIIGSVLAVAAAVFAWITIQALPPRADLDTMRAVLRAAAATAASATGLCVVVYCVLWRVFKTGRETATGCGATTH
jgi:hypothetical protein